jgi:hypothetical protein
MNPYVLWFGKYRHHAVEQLMFDPAGYEYLVEFILKKINDKPKLVERVREVVRRGDHPHIETCCQICRRPATHMVAHGNCDEGYHFSHEGYCEEHIPSESWEMQVELKFSGVFHFRKRVDQQAFMRAMRRHCGLEGTRLTPEVACNFFYPE